MRNPCKKCLYYQKENNTCQSKKCCTGREGYVGIFDMIFCLPYEIKEKNDTRMSDVISRQAAIDAVIKRDANCGIDSAEALKLLIRSIRSRDSSKSAMNIARTSSGAAWE